MKMDDLNRDFSYLWYLDSIAEISLGYFLTWYLLGITELSFQYKNLR